MTIKEKLNQCHKYYKNREFDKVIILCDEILKIKKDDEKALGYKISSLEFLERDDEALSLTDYALELYPKNPHFLFSKARILHCTLNDLDGAITYYEKGLALVDPDKYWGQVYDIVFALNDKADELIKAGEIIKAIEAYEKILKHRPREYDARKKIDSLVEKYDINYRPSSNYRISLQLEEILNERIRKIDDYLDSIEIGQYDDDYIRGCNKFKKYNSFDEYVRDVLICLMEGYPKNSLEDSKFLVRCNFEYVKSTYENRLPADYCVIEVGYCCG